MIMYFKIEVFFFVLLSSIGIGLCQINELKQSNDTAYYEYLESISELRNASLKELPLLKKKFLNGELDSAEVYFVVILRDSIGRWEQVYMRVRQWQEDNIAAELSTNMNVVKGYPFKSIFTFSEDKCIDWIVIYPNGKEEGNFIGKYFESLKK